MTDLVDLNELSKRESEQVEWKENVADENDVVATLTAFANDLQNLGGGYVVCGAKEDKDEYGFPRVVLAGLTASRLKEVEGKVLQRCRERVEPAIQPLVHELPSATADRRILVFIMPATRSAHQFRKDKAGAYYVRSSRSTIEARNGILRELLVRKGAIDDWDRRPCLTATVQDLDLLVLRDTLHRMNINFGAERVDEFLSEARSLSPLIPSLCVREPLTGILRPRNFAMLLFGRNPQAHIPGSYSLFSIYPGRDRSDAHAERHELTGSLMEQARRLLDLLDAQTWMTFDKTNRAHPNSVKYPARALQETMMNTLAHRDYESVDPARVTVFADRIEFVSPGALPAGVSAGELREGRATPKWRNQSLAWILVRLQLAQAEGQGIPTILRTMREEGCPPPQFEANAARVACILPAHPLHVSGG